MSETSYILQFFSCCTNLFFINCVLLHCSFRCPLGTLSRKMYIFLFYIIRFVSFSCLRMIWDSVEIDDHWFPVNYTPASISDLVGSTSGWFLSSSPDGARSSSDEASPPDALSWKDERSLVCTELTVTSERRAASNHENMLLSVDSED